jgi:hypothetical protein
MSVHLGTKKEILSFHELERRKLFHHNKLLLKARLEAMEREIIHLTAIHKEDFKPKGPVKATRIESKKIVLTPEEAERERNWPRDIGWKFQKEFVAMSSTSNKKKTNSNQHKRLAHSASAPLLTTSLKLTPTRRGNSKDHHKDHISTSSYLKRKKGKPKLVPIGGGFGPRFPRPVLSGVINGPTPQDYTLKGDFGSHPKGEMVETFAWDETRDRDWFKEGGMWDLRMKNLANERKASLLARQQAAKKMQSRRLKQEAKDELVSADQNDKRQKNRPRNWFIKSVLEGSETLTFQYLKAGQLGTSAEQNFGKRG